MFKKSASRTLLGLGTVTAPIGTPPPEILADVTLPPLLVKNNPTVKDGGTLLFTVKLKAGWLLAPVITGAPIKPTPLASVLPARSGCRKRRYQRRRRQRPVLRSLWNLGDRPMTLREYRRQIGYAYKGLLPKDWRERDVPAAMITLLLPHYLFWRSGKRIRPLLRSGID